MSFENLFSPIRLRNVQLKNRVVLTPHGPNLPPARFARYLEERAKGGIGLMICSSPVSAGVTAYSVTPPNDLPGWTPEGTDVRLPNPATREGAKYFDDVHLPLMQQLAAAAHRHNVACFGQIVHMGTYIKNPDWEPGLSPSAVPDEMFGETPHALTIREIEDVIVVFSNAAARVKAAGMDGVEVHGCHGLLLNSFLSPLTNLRTDQYGGSPENRARLIREVVTEVRRRVGEEFVVGIRLPGNEMVDGGLSPSDIAHLVRSLAAQLDYVSVSAGAESGRKGGITMPAVPSSDWGEAVFADSAAVIKQSADVPVLLAGRIVRPDLAEQLLREGKADLIGMVRALIADPDWATKAKDGKLDEIRGCTGGNEGCRQRTQFRTRHIGLSIACTVNASVGREEELGIRLADHPKRVLIAGGGPGGMEAARVASLRGHHVTLCEQARVLGGQVVTAALDPRNAGLGEVVRYLSRQLLNLPVEICMETEVKVADTKAFDAVIVATGSLDTKPAIPGALDAHVVTSSQVLRGEVTVGARVCVVAGFDGQRGPLGLAELLADGGHQVDLITERAMVGESLDPASNHFMLKRLFDKQVRLHPFTALKGVQDHQVILCNSLTQARSFLDGVDTVVIASGGTANNDLYSALEHTGKTVLGVGDCLAPRRVLHAIREGARAAHTL